MQKIESGNLHYLTQVSYLISQNQVEQANQLLDAFVPDDDISQLCADSLRVRSRDVVTSPLYVEKPNDADDKQINVFDLVLKSVAPVQAVSHTALDIMKNVYNTGVPSFTHLNIGIGKGHFEAVLLRELAASASTLPHTIRIIGIDVDAESLRESGERIQQVVDELYPATTKVEYTPIQAFIERVDDSVWEMVKNHGTEILCIVSAFTLHHIPTADQRNHVMKKIAGCDPLLFTLLEPDSDHFTSNLPERLVNCWNLFGTIFKLIDREKLREHEARAIKHTFFGREIKDILSHDEEKRSEKHERATAWTRRMQDAGFNLHQLIRETPGSTLNFAHGPDASFTTTTFEGVPMVAIMTASRQV